ncbi:MAG: Hsp33 family molecular chaperone HslO [Acidobacteriota bacterium]|nr:Hsp33 family molecular chaperone HslO [Acidobacteriota bacterium]MDH3530773.1 Hsp33 family molecular chaperone HslO [Acidobacteriota bacterium]
MDKLEIGIGGDGQVRVLAAITTETVTEGVRRHSTSPTASAAFGRVLTGSALLAASLKDFDRLTVRIDAEGPIRGIVGEADRAGNVRGYVRNPLADAGVTSDGKLDVRSIVGSGMFYVIRESGFDVGLRKDPYIGSVPIISGEIAEDFAHYLFRSEQIPSAVLLGVLINNQEPFVAASGGVMVQMMPGANEHLVTMIEDTIRRAPHLTSCINEGAGPSDLVSMVLGEIPFEMVDSRDVEFKCGCSPEKAETLIAGLGKDEVDSMLKEDKGAVMNCGFCREEFVFDETQLAGLLERI